MAIDTRSRDCCCLGAVAGRSADKEVMAIDKRSRDCCCLREGAKREKSAWFI